MGKYRNIMKGIVSSFFIFGIMMSVFANGVFAAAVVAQGNVQLSGGGNAVGANVTATCNAISHSDITNSSGNYSITFPNGECDNGDTMTVDAELNGETGSTSATAGNGNLDMPTIFLAAVAVPEFGVITGLIAAAGSAAAYFGLKRKMA